MTPWRLDIVLEGICSFRGDACISAQSLLVRSWGYQRKTCICVERSRFNWVVYERSNYAS